ncbi:hypothetical protein F2P81_008713 [Scophthalmus maximus]|uniref:Uncharacterized protein n=1 Tax=Scophthalmus maximus TaxID=52904 RepID=A0A6A4SZR2_SCOMX|nr:hypothetical protein F2P81_008713 [Scophthalmus maximus]
MVKSVDSPLSPHLKETTEGASAIRASGEVILPQKDAQPEGLTVETADDTKPQAHAKERNQNGEAQRENTVANKAEENKEGCADTPAEQSNTDHTEAKSPEDALLEVKMKPEEEPSVATEPASGAHLEDAELIIQPAERSCNERPPEQAAEGVFEAVAVVVLESSHYKSDVINATPGYGAAPQNSVETIPDLLLESLSKSPTHQTILDPVSESPTQSADNTTVKSVECEVEPATPTEAALKTRAEEAVECEVHPVNNTVVVQSAEKAADQVMELSITDALDFETASDAGAITEVTAEAVPEPVDDPKQSHSDESNLNQSDDTKM